MHANGSVVVASDITRRYGGGDTAVDALRGITLEVSRGQLTTVMGPSGSGKSTLMHILAGLDRPTSGSVAIEGTEITTLGDTDLTKLRREHIGFIFQFFNLLPMLNAEENVLLPLTIAGEKPDKAWFEELLTSVGLQDRRKHRPAELSGGQQQRVAIARALVSKPTVVFADEPTGNLDSKTGGEILELMRYAVETTGQTTVMVTHDARSASIADRILFLADGNVVKELPRSQPHDVIQAMEEVEVIRFSLRALATRKMRTALTAIAIVLGVALVTGTYVLTDSIKGAFNGIFNTVYEGTDATITGQAAFDLSSENQSQEPPFDESLLGEVRKLPDVQDAIGGVGGEAQLIGKNGKVIVFGGAPNLGFSVDPTRPAFNSLTLVKGEWPKANELVVDKGTAGKKHIEPGDTIGVQGAGPAQKMRISGLVRFGGASSIGGATLAGFDLPTAQALFDKKGQLDQIRAKAKPGVTPEQLAGEIQGILPTGTQVRTGEAQAKEDAKDTETFLNFLQDFLLAFGGIALFVGAFVIANSLSITIAQRTRELATLRTLGASRRQVRFSIMVEALVMGTLASIAGIFVGLGLGVGLFKLFDAVGFTLPNNGLVLHTRTVVVALLVGIIVTLLASLRPAFRATRVPPIAAVREGAVLPGARHPRLRTVGSVVLTALGFAALAYGMWGASGTTNVLVFMGLGTLLVFFGVALLSARIARPLAWALGWPASKFGGAAGALARDNARRNPQRTASTASALMIGLALVTLVAVLAAGITKTFRGAVNDLWVSGYAITAENNFSPIPPAAGNAAATTPGVEAYANVRGGDAQVLSQVIQATAVNPEAVGIFNLKWVAGPGDSVISSLGKDGAFVDNDYADKRLLEVGSPLTLTSPNGKQAQLLIKGIFDPPSGGSPFGRVTISDATWDTLYDQPKNVFSFVQMKGGETDANKLTLENELKGFPNAKVQTKQEFIDNQISGLNAVLNVLFVLLALSVIVSLFGIINTLVLTVFERTREIGMLRAVGMTRRQTRRMIRYESVITALLGGTLGIGLGIVLGALLVIRVDEIDFSLPIGQLIIFALATIVVGIVAAIFPARRAAKLNVLEALQYRLERGKPCSPVRPPSSCDRVPDRRLRSGESAV